jgi:hypothetical protein
MTYKFYCTHCGQHIEASGDVSGTHVSCPICGQGFHAPVASTVSPNAPTTPPPLPVTPSPKKRDWKAETMQAFVVIGGLIGAVIGFAVFHSASAQTRVAILSGGVVGVVCALIPYFYGRRKYPNLAKQSFWICGFCGAVLGLVLALPVSLALNRLHRLQKSIHPAPTLLTARRTFRTAKPLQPLNRFDSIGFVELLDLPDSCKPALVSVVVGIRARNSVWMCFAAIF